MTSTCKYCGLILQEHNDCQERACHQQYRKYIKQFSGKKSVMQLIKNRWEYSR